MAGAVLYAQTYIQNQADASYRILKAQRLHKQDLKSLKVQLNFILNNRAGCLANFGSHSVTGNGKVSIASLNFGDGTGQPGDLFLSPTSPTRKMYGRKTLKNIELEPHAFKFGPPGAGPHLTVLKLQFDDLKSVSIPMYVNTTASGQITSCHSTSFIDLDPVGFERTIEEKYCQDSATPEQTTNWKTGDCMDCLTGSAPFFMCVFCKNKGMTYDSSAQTCT